jgi:hypothetical protein
MENLGFGFEKIILYDIQIYFKKLIFDKHVCHGFKIMFYYRIMISRLHC